MNKKHLKLYFINLALAFIAGAIVLLCIIVLFKMNFLPILSERLSSSILLSLCLVIVGGLFIFTFRNVVESSYEGVGKHSMGVAKEFDNLTQIYTFDYFVDQLSSLKTPYSLVMIDIDSFKDINEKYGLVIGDLVLKVVAKAIKDNVRSADIIARYQGDAFVIILENCPENNALEIMGRIRQVIMENENLVDKNISISTSIGIYFVTETESNEILFRNVVEALKIAKENDDEHKVVLLKKDIITK